MWPGTLVREAVAAADPTYNFASYDRNGDCYVDAVNIIHQGTMRPTGSPNGYLVPKWNLNGAAYHNQSDGGEFTTNDACPASRLLVSECICNSTRNSVLTVR